MRTKNKSEEEKFRFWFQPRKFLSSLVERNKLVEKVKKKSQVK